MLIAPGAKVLFTGDSITDCDRRGQSFPLGNGYARMTADLLLARYPDHGLEVLNTGISGHNVRDLFDRWTDDVIRHQPDWLSIMIGINDVNAWLSETAGRSVSPEEYADLYEKILTRVKNETAATVVLIPPFFMSIDTGSQSYRRRVLAALTAYQQTVHTLAAQFGTRLVDFHGKFQRLLQQRSTDQFGPEPVHPNQTGHLIMAHEWLRTVEF